MENDSFGFMGMEKMTIVKGQIYPVDRDTTPKRLWVGTKTFIKHNLPLIGIGRKALLKQYFFISPYVEDGGTWPHIKLTGLHDVSPFKFGRVKRRYGRTGSKKDALGQVLSMSHENSDRIIARFSPEGVHLYTYTYRDGYGPATKTPHPDEIDLGEYICLVPYNTTCDIFIYRMSHETLYEVTVGDEKTEVYMENVKRPSFFQMVSSSHAQNGPSSPNAQATMEWYENHKW